VALSSTRVLTVGATELPYPLFVLTGTVLWQLFVDGLTAPLQRLGASRAILTKTRIPHEAVMLAALMEVLFNFAVRAMLLVPVLAWYGVRPSPAMLLAPVGVLALLLLGFAIGLLFAPAGLLYPDVPRGLTLAAGLLFFLSPVLYPLPATGPASFLRDFNPVAPLLSTARQWIAGGALPPQPGFGVVLALSLAGLLAGWSCYRVARPHLVSRL
jgi:lipopolysaccharide transport system permease protein